MFPTHVQFTSGFVAKQPKRSWLVSKHRSVRKNLRLRETPVGITSEMSEALISNLVDATSGTRQLASSVC